MDDAHPCPTCGEALSTEQGMRQHHSKVHGEPLPNRTCNGCGANFYDPKSQRSYCDDCNPNAGRNNGNWKGAKETTTCERCDSTFQYYPSEKEGVYCSECVSESDEFLGDQYQEVADVDRVERSCEYCETTMTVLQSTIENGRGRFCSRDCLSRWMSENRVGEDHHHWTEGEADYTGKWWSVRRRALERDDRRCQNCGRDEEDLGTTPDVHHVVPVREFDDPQDAHTLDNVVVLCRSCHRRVESGSVPLPDHDALRE